MTDKAALSVAEVDRGRFSHMARWGHRTGHYFWRGIRGEGLRLVQDEDIGILIRHRDYQWNRWVPTFDS